MLTVIVSIFASRYILQGLGIRDYGIYNVVGGVIGLMGFVTATLSNTSTRFIANSLGKENFEHSVLIFLSVKRIVKKVVWFLLVSLVIVGSIFVNFILNIPFERQLAANIVFLCMIVNTVYSVLTAPYSALLYAREKIAFLSIVQTLNSVLVLGLAFLLTIVNADNLVLYAFLLMVLSFVNRTILVYYCHSRDEIAKTARIRNNLRDKKMDRDILSFSGWNLLESIGIIIDRQGAVFLVNIFFGVLMNAAYGIAYVVSTQMRQFSYSLLNAIKPHIYKTFETENKIRQGFFVFFLSKVGVVVLLFIIPPIISDIDFILQIWLVEVPEYASIFIKLSLVLTLVRQLSYGLIVSMQALGRVKQIQTVTFVLQSLNFPLTYIFYRLGYPVYYLYFVAISTEFVIVVGRLIIARNFIGLNAVRYVFDIVIKPVTIFVISVYALNSYLDFADAKFFGLLTAVVINTLVVGIYSYFIILGSNERSVVDRLLLRLKNVLH